MSSLLISKAGTGRSMKKRKLNDGAVFVPGPTVVEESYIPHTQENVEQAETKQKSSSLINQRSRSKNKKRKLNQLTSGPINTIDRSEHETKNFKTPPAFKQGGETLMEDIGD